MAKREVLYPHLPKGRKGAILAVRSEYITITLQEIDWRTLLSALLLAEGAHLNAREFKEAEAISSVMNKIMAKTEGNPVRKFCCRLCGDCASPELLEEGRFPDRIAWLRHHYKEEHPSVWGRR